MSESNLLNLSISTLHGAYRTRTTSVSETVEAHLARIQNQKWNAFLTVTGDSAREKAKHLDAELGKDPTLLDRLPLLGVPVAIKDNLATRGVRTSCASKMLEAYVPPYSATCVERLEAAGAIIVGKTNMDEFAMGGSNENSAFGPVLNPRDPSRIPGGSSGGSAAAVAGELATLALGSDTGGSIRLPASFCGIVGMKPTYGSVSRYGLVAFASSLDQVGPFGSCVSDVRTALHVISGHDPRDSTSAPRAPIEHKKKQASPQGSIRGLRVGVPKEHFQEGLDPEVEKAVRDGLKQLEKRGATLVDVSLPYTPYAVAVYYLVAVSEASSNLARFDGIRFGSRPSYSEMGSVRDLQHYYSHVRSLFGPEVKRRIMLGTFALSAGYADQYYNRACQVRRLIQADYLKAYESVDVLAGPVTPVLPFKLGEKLKDPLKMYLNDIFTIPANLGGFPSLSLPLPTSGLPTGLQIQGPAFSDARLLDIADELERELR